MSLEFVSLYQMTKAQTGLGTFRLEGGMISQRVHFLLIHLKSENKHDNWKQLLKESCFEKWIPVKSAEITFFQRLLLNSCFRWRRWWRWHRWLHRWRHKSGEHWYDFTLYPGQILESIRLPWLIMEVFRHFITQCVYSLCFMPLWTPPKGFQFVCMPMYKQNMPDYWSHQMFWKFAMNCRVPVFLVFIPIRCGMQILND